MTRFLLDTTVIIDVLSERRNRLALIRDLIAQQHELACCPVNVTEVYTGMRAVESGKTERLLRSLAYIPISFDAARLAGELRQNWLRKGKIFSVPDMIIAAICITEKLTLVTDNRKDFAMPEVKLHPLEA
jgi:predicted nucleic acid-binding protein